jgi:chemotaxis protein methyltransferase CheR
VRSDPATPPEVPTWPGPAYQGLRERVLRAGGIDIGLYKDRCVLRRLGACLRAAGAYNLAAYCRRLDADPEELQRLVETLTVNVSEFFRNRATYRALAREVFPRLVREKRAEGRRGIRLWSAGCATGEEPYSLAIALSEHLGAARSDFSIVVLASDVDAASLAVAQAGQYPGRSVARLPRAIVARYFEQTREGYRVSKPIRKMVHFRQHNLLDPFPFTRIDVAMFRNVLIYMTRPLQSRLLEAFYDILNPGGFLVLGRVEGLAGPARDRFEVINLAERIYRRPLPARRGPAPYPFRQAQGR